MPLGRYCRHDGGRAEYTVSRDGNVEGLEVEPPQPEDGWSYPEYPQAFSIVRYECSEFEPIDKEQSLRLLHQHPGADADRDILVIIPSRSNDPSLPVNFGTILRMKTAFNAFSFSIQRPTKSRPLMTSIRCGTN